MNPFMKKSSGGGMSEEDKLASKKNVLKGIGNEARDWMAEDLAASKKPAVEVAVEMPAKGPSEMEEPLEGEPSGEGAAPEAGEGSEMGSLEDLLKQIIEEHPELLEKLMASKHEGMSHEGMPPKES